MVSVDVMKIVYVEKTILSDPQFLGLVMIIFSGILFSTTPYIKHPCGSDVHQKDHNVMKTEILCMNIRTTMVQKVLWMKVRI